MMFLVVLLSTVSFAQELDTLPYISHPTPYQRHLWDLAGCMAEPLDCPLYPNPVWNHDWIETEILTNNEEHYAELMFKDGFGYVTIDVADLPVVSEWRRDRSFNWFDVAIYQPNGVVLFNKSNVKESDN